MFFKDFVSVKREKIKRGASQTYDTPSLKTEIFSAIHGKNAIFAQKFEYERKYRISKEV